MDSSDAEAPNSLQGLGQCLGRAADMRPMVLPWQKSNRPDRTPWENEEITWNTHKPKAWEQTDSEAAWREGLEETQAMLDSLRPIPARMAPVEEAVEGARVEEKEEERRQSVRELTIEPRARPDMLILYVPTPYEERRKPRKRPEKNASVLDPPSTVNTFGVSNGNNDSSNNNSVPRNFSAERSWPEPRQKGERRLIAANYGAVEIHGFFGLIDDGSDGAGRMLIVHVPRWVKGYFMDIKQGDTIHVYHGKGLKVGGRLTVLATGRHEYKRPGRRVTTCTICVPEEQWVPFR